LEGSFLGTLAGGGLLFRKDVVDRREGSVDVLALK
jgi:hypothetical protein